MLDGLANHLERFRQPDALVGQHVAEVVEGHGVGGVEVEDLAEELLGGLEVLLPLGQLAAQEEQVDAVFLFGGEGLGLVEGVFGIFPAAQADIHLAERDPDDAVVVGVVEQALGHGEAFVGFALVGQLAGQHQLQVAILGIGRDGLAGDFDGLVELLGVAVGVHLALVAAHGGVAAHVDHLLVGGDGLVGLVLLVIDGAEALEEDAAVVLFLVGVGAVGVGGEIDHGRVGLRGLVEAAQHVEQQAFVVAGFEACGVELARFLDGGQRIFILALAALNLGDVDERLGVVGVGLGQLLDTA